MLQSFIESIDQTLSRYHGNLQAASEILNDLFGPALKAYGVSRVVAPSQNIVVLTMRGLLNGGNGMDGDFVRALPRTVEINMNELNGTSLEKAAEELRRALGAYIFEGDGAHVWVVPDGFMAELTDTEKQWERDGGGYFSHEALCVQNTASRETSCELQVFFEEDGREVRKHTFTVPAKRSIHLRIDKIPGQKDEPFVPKGQPVGYKVISFDTPVVVQGSRILTSGKDSEFASFGTVMAWRPE